MKKYKKGIAWGVWDFCHEGHLNILREAKKQCEKLIVGVSSDRLVIDKKGHKPFFSYRHRKDLIKSLQFVDEVIPQDKKNTKKRAVKKYKPDVIFVGDDWKGKNWEGEKLGLPVKFIKYTKKTSSTKIRDKLIKLFE